MIQIIGIMIGFYIFTKMLELGNSTVASGTTKVFGGITAVVVIICVFTLLVTGAPSIPLRP